LKDELFLKLKQGLDPVAKNLSTGIWVGFKNENFSLGVGAGYSDVDNQIPAKSSNLIPAGSLTKSMTTVAIMRLVEAGNMSFYHPLPYYIDSWLQMTNGTTSEQLFGKMINNVTLAHLLHMNSGIQDYDDDALWKFVMANPTYNIEPMEYIYQMNRTFVCFPGTCMYYSSINFILAGFALCQYYGIKDYRDLNQHALVFEPGTYTETVFPKDQLCSDFPDIPHLYAWQKKVDKHGDFVYRDMINSSCLNGWTCGNVAISAGDAASFYYDLFTERFLSGFSLVYLNHLDPLSFGWGKGLQYGYGVFNLGMDVWGWHNSRVHVEPKNMFVIGHGGSDYGSYITAGYNPTLKFAFSVGVNKDYFKHNSNYPWCIAEKIILSVMFPDLPAECTWDPRMEEGINSVTNGKRFK